MTRPRALFEPPDGKRLLVIGQDFDAIREYVTHVAAVPAGVTTYTHVHFLRTLQTKTTSPAGVLYGGGILDDARFDNSVLSIGLHLGNRCRALSEGRLQRQVRTLAAWIRAAKRPVFLRIGYEFDGSWNSLEPASYRAAFRVLAQGLRANGATNCATVWQSATSPVNGNKEIIYEDWYPGDDVVDWIGFSWFLVTPRQDELTNQLLAFARARQKPVMLCEATPQGYDLDRLTRRNIAVVWDGPAGQGEVRKSAQEIWSEWFQPFFAMLNSHRELIRIAAYINTNWDRQRMWGHPYPNGYWGDSRVQANPFIREYWIETLRQPDWLPGSPGLFGQLGFQGGE